ncbi:MAG: F0F1 ATP synthase subunit delta [Bacteroidaceae bacterium]|nr:F0F1 ATP synthase subunit delta [Bacteroidaceae bacterium]
MITGVIAKRYAKALLRYAEEQRMEDVVYEEMNQFLTSCFEVPGYLHTLSNPTLKLAQKEQLLCGAVSNQPCSLVCKKFASLVVTHRRESFMPYIAYSYILLYREVKHICIGHLITAAPVTDEVKKRLEDWIEEQTKHATDVIMRTEVDPSLMGGFIFRVDDYRLDASVATQFELIKKQFIEKNKRIV